jgi:hypothetical protein
VQRRDRNGVDSPQAMRPAAESLNAIEVFTGNDDLLRERPRGLRNPRGLLLDSRLVAKRAGWGEIGCVTSWCHLVFNRPRGSRQKQLNRQTGDGKALS